MEQLFTPVKLGGLTLPNRLVRSATQDPFSELSGQVSDKQVALYGELAASGIGLIVSGHVCVSPEGRVNAVQNSFYSDEFIDGQRRLVEAVHAHGGLLAVQLSHSGSAGMSPQLLAPSDVQDNPKAPLPKPASAEELERIKADFAAAAVRAKAAGFDAIQLHCAAMYLLSEFLSPYYNKREDEFGGAEGRRRFPLQVVDAVREAVGPDYPLLIKINSNAMEDNEAYEAAFPGLCADFAAHGIDAIEITGFDQDAKNRAGDSVYYLPAAKRVMAQVPVPVLLAGGIRTRTEMEGALDSGVACISMSRPYICQPDMAKRLRDGEEKGLCTSCSKCFMLYYREKRRCVFHPAPEAAAAAR